MCAGHSEHRILYIGAYGEDKTWEYKRLCYMHSVKEACKGVRVESSIDTESEDYKGCHICGY